MEEVINIDNKIDADNSHEYRGDHDCNYLVVFSSKYKRSLFVDDIAENLSSIFHKIALKNGFIISKLDIFPSYCELIIQCDPELGITECIKKLKRSSEGELKKMYPELSRRAPCIWTRQIFIRSIGYVFGNEIHEFINRQSKV